jgi:hypothetical protein
MAVGNPAAPTIKDGHRPRVGTGNDLFHSLKAGEMNLEGSKEALGVTVCCNLAGHILNPIVF